MSWASRSAKRFFFSLGRRDGLRLPQFGPFDGWSLRNHLGNGLSSHAMSQRIGRTVSWGALLGAVAVCFTAFAEPRSQKPRTPVVQLSQTLGELIAFFLESF